MTDYSPSDDLALALALAGDADLISLDRFTSGGLDVSVKADSTFVTDADTAVERSIRAGIEASRPRDSIFGEEYGTQGNSARQWIIDPIDGTSNFLRGVPIWGTLIALAVDGVPVVGVVSAPALGRRWWAARGHGAWLGMPGSPNRRLRVSAVDTLDRASLGYNRMQGWDEAGRLDDLLGLTRTVWKASGIGDMFSYMLLAEGAIDVVAELDLKPYDMAALVPIVEEAGGTFTDLKGTPGPWGGTALASNSVLHTAVLDRLDRK